MSDAFPIQNGLDYGHTSSWLPFSFVLKYAIRRIQENQERLKFNGTPKLLVCAVDITLLGDNITTTNKNAEAQLHTSKKADQEINAQKNN
jgi:hypothetical protein